MGSGVGDFGWRACRGRRDNLTPVAQQLRGGADANCSAKHGVPGCAPKIAGFRANGTDGSNPSPSSEESPLTLSSPTNATPFRIILWRCWATAEHGIAWTQSA